jgi:hypothetical protein
MVVREGEQLAIVWRVTGEPAIRPSVFCRSLGGHPIAPATPPTLPAAYAPDFYGRSRCMRDLKPCPLLDIAHMKIHYILCMLLAGSVDLGVADVAISQSSPDISPAPTSSKVPAPEFKPGLDDLMTMLVQPRHIKLYYAGTRKNWELAASQARDLRAALARVAQFIPKYIGIDVDEALGSIMTPKLKAMDAAIVATDPKQFARAYEDVTAACNACHSYMEHPFYMIKVPASTPTALYPDQEFGANP